MSDIPPYYPGRFSGAIPYYERYRLTYPDRLIQRVIALAGLVPGDAVLDLGTGPGFLAIPFAQAGMIVTAADPEPLMLDATAVAAERAQVSLSLWMGGSNELTPDMGPYKLVVIGRAFHWMDRTKTMAMLDRIVAPGGGVVIFHDGHPSVPENGWFRALREVCYRYSKDTAHARDRKTGAHQRYEPYLFASSFKQIDGLSVTNRTSITADDIVGRAYSFSTCAPDLLGQNQAGFEADLRAAIAPFADNGVFTEVAEMTAVMARRPGQGA